MNPFPSDFNSFFGQTGRNVSLQSQMINPVQRQQAENRVNGPLTSIVNGRLVPPSFNNQPNSLNQRLVPLSGMTQISSTTQISGVAQNTQQLGRKRKAEDKNNESEMQGEELLNFVIKSTHFLKQLSTLINDRKTADIKFKVEDQEFYGHQIMFITRSSTFNDAFQDLPKEVGSMVEFEIPNCSPVIFEKVLPYFYGSEITIEDDNVYGIYLFANQYHLWDLEEEAIDYLKNHLSINNCLKFLQLSFHFQKGMFYQNTLSFVLKNISKIFVESSYYSLPLLILLQLLNNSQLNISALELTIFVSQWVHVQQKTLEEQKSFWQELKPALLRRLLEPKPDLNPDIRLYLHLSLFSIGGEPAFDSKEIVDILNVNAKQPQDRVKNSYQNFDQSLCSITHRGINEVEVDWAIAQQNLKEWSEVNPITINGVVWKIKAIFSNQDINLFIGLSSDQLLDLKSKIFHLNFHFTMSNHNVKIDPIHIMDNALFSLKTSSSLEKKYPSYQINKSYPRNASINDFIFNNFVYIKIIMKMAE